MRSNSALYMGQVDSEIQTGSSPVPKEWNRSTVPFSRNHTVLDFFRAQVPAPPECLAIKRGRGSMSCRYLDMNLERIASDIHQRELSPACLIIVLLHPSCELLVAIIEFLKAGRVCAPVDAKIPAERLSLPIDDRGACLMLSVAADCGRLTKWPARHGRTHRRQGLYHRFPIHGLVEPFQKIVRRCRQRQAAEQS